MQKEVLLSIKPEYVRKIFEGKKKYEFRRAIFKDKNINKVIVYASAPISKIVGEFTIDDIIYDKLNSLWNVTEKESGISKDYFFNYFEAKDSGYAIKIKNCRKYENPICIKIFGFTPPQSFMYIDVGLLSN